MTLSFFLIFVPACFALNMAPGPNNLLSVSNATRFGFVAACKAGLGRLVAFAIMIAITAAGLAVILQASELAFYAIKIFGALYLFYLAFQLWRAPAVASLGSGAGLQREQAKFSALARQEFLIAIGNPKAILIFTAFLPQFVDPAQPAAPQFAVLGGIFLVLEWVAIAAYAYMGSHLGRWFAAPERKRAFNRTCGTLLGASGVGLLFARQ